jgi:hypothetical protein
MRGFASVAVDQSAAIVDQFQGCLAPLEGTEPDPETLSWLRSEPEAWADLTRNPHPAGEVMGAYVEWIRSLPTAAVLVAHPLVFDGLWIDWYLRKFTGLRVSPGAYGGERLFIGGIDLQSLVMGATGWTYDKCRRNLYPDEWFGGHVHTHRAIDDALGYAHVLSSLLSRQRDRADAAS